ncbi:MAG: HipA domain-containing protein, partial [Oligoflexus sp.]|nr:HipA domain-containing protein [Oligoflexus sp.]
LSFPETRLFDDDQNRQWFGVKRFDRTSNGRIHMHSAAGVLQANFRLPSIRYESLLKLTSALTRRKNDLLAIYRLAIFNVVFHNKDDHAKNFAFTMDQEGSWRLAPGFDLTFSTGMKNQHMSDVLGLGQGITLDQLRLLGNKAGVSRKEQKEIIDEVLSTRSFLKKEMAGYGLERHSVLRKLEDHWKKL